MSKTDVVPALCMKQSITSAISIKGKDCCYENIHSIYKGALTWSGESWKLNVSSKGRPGEQRGVAGGRVAFWEERKAHRDPDAGRKLILLRERKPLWPKQSINEEAVEVRLEKEDGQD